MINVLATPQRARAISLANRILETLPTDPTFRNRYSQAEVHAARAEMVLRAGRCVAEVDRRHRQMAEDAQAFIGLTEEFVARHPLALSGSTNDGAAR